MYESHNIMSLLRGMTLMSCKKSFNLTGVLSCRTTHFLLRDKSVDLAGVLSCRATLFECLRHNLLGLRQVSSM